MNLIILDDNCTHPLRFISDFRNSGHEDTIIKFLYYQHNEKELEMDQKLIDLYNRLEVDIIHIDPLCFFNVMNPLFLESQNIFLFDFSLDGDDVPDIYKMHIGYALNKISKNSKNKMRFFFYTTAANAEQLSNLRILFNEHVVVGSEADYYNQESVSIDFESYINFIEIMNGEV